jgi:hypothetical protein
MREPNNAERDEGLENLLVNCAGISKGTHVLFVNEPDTITVDRATIDLIEGAARDLGADVHSMWIGPVPGPESIPENVIAAIRDAQVSIFNHSIGGMMRLRPMPGSGMGILNYATTPELLASPWARVPYGLWKQVAKAVADEFKQSLSWHITCPHGTDLRGTVPENERQPSATPSGFMLHTFPIGTHQPTSAETVDGTLAIRWLVSSANHDVGDGLRLKAPIVADISTGRITGFSGDQKDISDATRYLEEIGTRYDKDPYLINSWHGGTNPLAFTPAKDVTHLNWWQLLVHNNPRTLHFHAIGEDMPGELSLPILDPRVEIDGEVVWDRGRFTMLDRPAVQSVIKAWPGTPEMFTLNPAIGV